MIEAGEHTPEEKPRAIARRRQVLEAAARCFRLHGFHACSMAQISAEADMSVGHIYRYFTGKEAIITAIVREDVDEILCKMAEFPLDAPDVRGVLLERAEQGVIEKRDREHSALMLEIRAEAARNPAIAELVRETDARMSEQLRVIIAAAVGRKLTDAELDARVEMFHLIFQGVELRTAINPAMDRVDLARHVRGLIETILS
jgi:AcrR family transcriptional regulator